ncbi:CD80-like immunoglobulin C2-set [Trinorchestia longiramus]|nr:CD80-like immunoglobulin C2-set [Trinorchestia longiramus]
MTGLEDGVDAGSSYEVSCRAHGSHPPAILTWDLQREYDWHPLTGFQERQRGMVSESKVLLTVHRRDHSKKLSCTATNPSEPRYRLSNTTRLIVRYAPIARLVLGWGLDGANITEGMDVYFTCVVDAVPPPSSIRFYKQVNIGL